MARRLARAVIVVAATLVTVSGIELALQVRARILDAKHPTSPRRERNLAYAPFAVQHLHPQYFVFFPLDPRERLALGNSVCSIDASGFREPGPAQAGGRRLAVLLGGSAAFGFMASSDDATIASYLNRLQDQFFFVSAGVPSWTSSQSLLRLTLEIADLEPALIISYEGANDAAVAGMMSPRGTLYPPGTPESFDLLDGAVNDLRQRRFRWPVPWPELAHRWEKGWRRLSPGAEDDMPRAIGEAALHYRRNMDRMALQAHARGSRFVSVFQPVGSLHQRMVRDESPFRDRMVEFHDAVLALPPPAHDFLDLGSMFDRYFDTVTVTTTDDMNDAIFLDNVHLGDRGNELVARHLWERLR